MTQRPAYKIVLGTDERFISISVPELDLLSQARHPGEIAEMARDLIAVSLDVEPDSFDLMLVSA